MAMPGRTFNSQESPNGFNGKRKDDEIYGSGNAYDFGARIYDPRLARFLSLDPRIKDFPELSPYAFAANMPIRYVDVDGQGPGDRIKAARNLVGTIYKQEGTSELRTGSTTQALQFVDCSEFVCRVLRADDITKKVEWKRSSDLKTFFDDDSKFEHTEATGTPKVGDFAVWEGHVGIVSEVDSEGKFKLIHAPGVGKKVNENKYAIKANQYRDSKFYGFYRPKVETKEGKDVSNGTKASNAEGTTTSGTTTSGTTKNKQEN